MTKEELEKKARLASKDFLENEKQFHLGVIPTEQSNPLTKNLSWTIQNDTEEGIRTILSADVNIPKVAAKAFKSKPFLNMVADIKRCMYQHKTFLFSSVGASGRLALQLDATWRKFWTELVSLLPDRKEEFIANCNCSNSLTTGGDRALVRSVENYEDYMTFGAKQIDEAGVGEGDVVLALSECGLSASINGSAIEAQKKGCTTYYLFCNPKEILCQYLDRARVVFENKKIIKIPLFVGNMAVSGSTRMQVTTVELLVMGAALEVAAGQWLKENLTDDEYKVVLEHGYGSLDLADYAKGFAFVNKSLGKGKAVSGLAKAIEYEKDTYDHNGLITYITHDYLVDIMTDTTERQPTFTLPPFRKFLDREHEVSWAYIKDPLYPSSVAWQHVFRRPIKGLEWTKEDYIQMKAAQSIIDNPPSVGASEVGDYNIGYEEDPSRYSRKPARLVSIDINGSASSKQMDWYNKELENFSDGIILRMGNIGRNKLGANEIQIPVKLPRTCMDLLTHVMVKLIFNSLSTGTMAKMGRVWGNWMIQVLPTNKKLIDRSTRIIANIAGIKYEEANYEFFKSYLGRNPEEEYRESYVVETLKRLGKNPNEQIK